MGMPTDALPLAPVHSGWTLTCRPSTAARRYVREVLPVWGLESLAEDAETVACELAANAERHARGPVTLDLTLYWTELLVEVGDGTPLRFTPPPPCPEAECGRGLQIVRALAVAHGLLVDPSAGRKSVWARLPRCPAGEQ